MYFSVRYAASRVGSCCRDAAVRGILLIFMRCTFASVGTVRRERSGRRVESNILCGAGTQPVVVVEVIGGGERKERGK
jgi:hypothetical protein